MEKVMDFLADNYTVFAIISGVLLLALIGLLMTNKKKKTVKVEDDAQPIKLDETIEPPAEEIAAPPMPQETLVINEEVSTPVSQVEPTLDSFVSTVTEVKVAGSDTTDESSNMLIIEDNPQSNGVVNNVVTDTTMNSGAAPAINVEAAPEENFLVLDDKAPSVGVEIKEETNNIQ